MEKLKYVRRIGVEWVNKLSGSETTYTYLALPKIKLGDVILAHTAHGPALALVNRDYGLEELAIKDPGVRIVKDQLNTASPMLFEIHRKARMDYLEEKIQRKAESLNDEVMLGLVRNADAEGAKLVEEYEILRSEQ